MKNKFILCSLLAMTLSACGQIGTKSIDQDTTAKAVLDYENNVIILPLDEYKSSPVDYVDYQKAYDIAYSQCFARHGKTYIKQTYTVAGTRTYGLWNVADAEKYGFSTPGLEDGTEQEQNDPATMESCGSEVSFLDDLSPMKADTEEIIGRISSEAYSAARDNPAWTESRKEWWSCLEQAGLTPRTGDSDWGTEQDTNLPQGDSSAAQEESIRLATIEARCSQDTGMAQELADLEASYQAPLVRKNQSALNEIKDDLQQRRQKLSDYLAANQ